MSSSSTPGGLAGSEVPKPLVDALEAASQIRGIAVQEHWHRVDGWRGWWLRVRVERDAPSTSYVPATTDWYLNVEDTFPWGRLATYPAKREGLTATFPHQNLNREGDSGVPWRTGFVCLEESVQLLGRQAAYTEEPLGEPERLAWRLSRLQEWLRRASRGELALPGDPFELPDFAPSPPVICFTEDEGTFAKWEARPDTAAGIAEIGWGSASKKWLFVRRFNDGRNRTILNCGWGNYISSLEQTYTSIWLRLSEVPVLRPWQAPVTWGELRQACSDQGIDLDSALTPLLHHVRGRRTAVLLLGFPIPKQLGAAPTLMHWQAADLGNLSKKAPKGFQQKEVGFLRSDMRGALADGQPMQWLKTENWHQDQVGTRGRIPLALRTASVLLIGAGALGSAVGELLIRGGIEDLLVVDPDRLEVGNLVRHVSDLRSVGNLKAPSLASRFDSLTPHAKVRFAAAPFPHLSEGELEQSLKCQIVIDTTGEDVVLAHMAQFPWDSERLFVSLSLGRLGKRLFSYAHSGHTFLHGEFRDAVGPWLALEKDEADLAGDPQVWAGTGCWNPVFPAEVEDVRLLASAGVKDLRRFVERPPLMPELRVWEEIDDDSGDFAGVRLAPPLRTGTILQKESDER